MNRQSRLWRAVPLLALLVLILSIMSLGAQSPQPTTPTPAERDLILTNRQQQRPQQALYQVEAQAAREGWTPTLARAAGDLWLQLGDMSNAAAYWEIALSGEPENTILMRQIAQTYLDLQRWSQAVDMVERLVQTAPDEAWGHYQLGLLRAPFDPAAAVEPLQIAAQSPDFNTVSDALLTILQTNPADSFISMRVGLVMMDYQLWSYAELAFAHAAVLNDPFPEALAYRGLARDWQGKESGAWIDQAVALAPENAQVRYVQGLHLRLIGDNPNSVNSFMQAVALDPGNPAYCAELGTAYSLVDDLPNAMLWLQQAVILSNNAPEFQRLLVLFYAEQAATLTSLGFDVEGQVSSVASDDPDVLAELGWSLYNGGDFIGAENQINAALAIDPQNPRALYYRARMLIYKNEILAAVPLLQLVAASESEFAVEAQRILTSLGY
jgi:tetratricopeptide (TPR) repeat protein